MEEIAELLRETREESGIELEEVSKDLEIEEIILRNIEEGKIGSFKDVFVLKNHICRYAKYLGLNPDDMLDDFNEYLFEYTSRIPVERIEKEIKEKSKEDNSKKVASPYTLNRNENHKNMYIFIYILIFALVVISVIWSINQITVDKKSAYIISYRK